ncbi:MAG: FG-GAP-like repeat-containing protein [Pyrinomonadaceae bacterium]
MKISRTFVILTFLLLITVSTFGQRLVVDPAFAPSINGSVDHVKITGDQKILIAGNFTTVNGQSRLKIARLNANGSLDTRFDANWVFGTSNLNNVRVKALTVEPNGKVYISGSFVASGTNVPDKILRLNSDGSLDQSLTSIPLIEGFNFGKGIRKVQPLPDGKFIACGYFSTVNDNSKSNLARFNSDGSFDSTLTAEINNNCYDVAVQPDGKYLVAGTFTTVNGSTRLGLVRFNSDDSVDTSFNAYSVNNQFTTDTYKGIKLLADGTMYVFHDPSTYGSILHLNADGSLRTRFLTDVDTPDTTGDIEVLPNGKILAVGDFFSAGTTDTQSDYFNRFTPDGKHDGSVRVDFFGAYQGTKAVEIAADDKIIVGGGFTSVRTNGVTISRNYLVRLSPQPVPIKHKYDFDGDGKDDLAVYRPSNGVWYINQSTNGFTSTLFGSSTDKPVAADYDGDGKADVAVFRNGVWYWMRSSNNTFASGITGQAGDIPQGGFNGRFYLRGSALPDGTRGLLVFRPSEAAFYLQNPYEQPHTVNLQGMSVTSSDIPVAADYDGDEYEDVAVFRDGNWYYLSSNDFRVWHFQFGLPGDIPVPADYDGDGRTDYAVFRPSNRVWYIQKSTEGFSAVQWGLETDLLVPADYDGDRKADIAVYRDGIWYILKADNSYSIESFGLAGDIPAQLSR